MNKQKLIPVLTGLLALQILLAVGLHIGGDNYEAAPSGDTLLNVDTGKIDTIRIDSGEQSVEFKRNGDAWTVVSLDFPADAEKITGMLEKLAGLERGWPAATSEEAVERFTVGEDAFVRHITLSSGGESQAELYVGTSAGLRKAHVRVPGESEIYAVGFGTTDAAVDPDSWIDKGVLQREADTIARVELSSGIVLERRDGEIAVVDPGENRQTDTAEAKKLLNKVADLRIKKTLGTEAKPEYELDNPSHSLTITVGDGETIEYRFNGMKDKGDYVLKSSNNDHYLTVSSFSIENIFDVPKDDLVEPAEPAGNEDAATEQSGQQAPATGTGTGTGS